MFDRKTLATQAYTHALDELYKGLPKELLHSNPEFSLLMAGYWAMVSFVADRPAMLIGDAKDPRGVIKLMQNEVVEAKADIDVYEKLRLELGDTAFFGLLSAGLLWKVLSPLMKMEVKHTLVWARDVAYIKQIDLTKATVEVATVKDVVNYPAEDLQIGERETVGRVIDRLPRIYKSLREKRKTSEVKPMMGYSHPYSHSKASRNDHGNAGGAYDF